MRPKLVIWSEASLVLISVVTAESFTKASGCERSASESLSARAAAEPSKPQNASVVSANVLVIIVPPLVKIGAFASRRTQQTSADLALRRVEDLYVIVQSREETAVCAAAGAPSSGIGCCSSPP